MAYKTANDALAALQKRKFQNSDEYKAAWNAYENYQTNKPGEYVSSYADKIKDTMSQIENRKPFSYDVNGDALYKQYKDQYVNLGRLGMMDTTANAATLTGGYGNSYAATAGNQAYQNYLNQLNAVVPELAQQAYGKYQDEGNRLNANLSLYQGLEDQDYGRYRDSVAAYNAELDRLYGIAQDYYDKDYAAFMDDTAKLNSIYSALYNQEQDAQDRALSWARMNADGSGGGGGSSPKDDTTTYMNAYAKTYGKDTLETPGDYYNYLKAVYNSAPEENKVNEVMEELASIRENNASKNYGLTGEDMDKLTQYIESYMKTKK